MQRFLYTCLAHTVKELPVKFNDTTPFANEKSVSSQLSAALMSDDCVFIPRVWISFYEILTSFNSTYYGVGKSAAHFSSDKCVIQSSV